jgi:hypothetical protein
MALSLIVPPQSAQVPLCPSCQRPIYPDIEHNPLCAQLQNLQSLIMRAAGTLEEDQAERWADLHERMTSLHGFVPDEIKTELRSLSERLSDLETRVSKVESAETATQPAADKEKERQVKRSGDKDKPS